VPKKPKAVVIIAGLALAGVLVILVATRFGIGVEPDSTIYFDAARNLASGDGLVVISGSNSQLAPLTHYPPLYSSLLALAAARGVPVETTARWLNAILLGANIFLVGISIGFCVRTSFWLPLIGAFLMLTAPDVLAIHSVAMSEPLYLVLTSAGLLSLGSYLQNQRRRFLLLASIAIAVSCLTRYVGVAGVATGVIALLFLSRDEGVWFAFSFSGQVFRRKVVDTLIFAAVSFMPFMLWSIRNHLASGGVSDRQVAFHPVKFQQIVAAFSAAAQWLLLGKVRGDIRFLGFIVEILALASLTIYLMMNRRTSGASGTPPEAFGQRPRHREEVRAKLPLLLVIFIIAYVALLVFTITFLETDNVLDSRSLLPVHVAALVLVPCLARSLYQRAESRSLRIVFVAFAVLLAASYSFRGARWLAHVKADGQGYASRAWKESPTIAAIQKLPTGIAIYSNGVDAIYYLTGRRAIYIPARIIHGTGRPNQNYDSEVEKMTNDMRERNGVLVYFHTLPERWFLPAESDLRSRLALDVHSLSDGSIFRINTSAPAR
jgi:hypothetical protein